MSFCSTARAGVALTACLAVAAGCATDRQAQASHSVWGRTQADPWGQKVGRAAEWYLQTHAATQRQDCSGLVTSILGRAGVTVSGNSRTLWSDAQKEGRVADQAAPGDLAFFDYTFDANANGRVDDELTHVAVVTSIEDNGTVVMIHRGSNQIKELRMNLSRPAVRRDGDRVLNDFLRAPSYGPADGPRLAGQLFHGFARPPHP